VYFRPSHCWDKFPIDAHEFRPFSSYFLAGISIHPFVKYEDTEKVCVPKGMKIILLHGFLEGSMRIWVGGEESWRAPHHETAGGLCHR
jgi:hypothetical protein